MLVNGDVNEWPALQIMNKCNVCLCICGAVWLLCVCVCGCVSKYIAFSTSTHSHTHTHTHTHTHIHWNSPSICSFTFPQLRWFQKRSNKAPQKLNWYFLLRNCIMIFFHLLLFSGSICLPYIKEKHIVAVHYQHCK